uniref:Uncharacterized protein n=1 Tax=Pithovirus LCPAC401 TaxID=2506595 RepID=A0A481Z9Q6_9VIRU|nr:MAG: hypothetical protein LCPAC401_01850 [Pithovirus LCPAC401]
MAEKLNKVCLDILDDFEEYSYYEMIDVYDDIREYLNEIKTSDSCSIIARIDERKAKDDELIHAAFLSFDTILKSDNRYFKHMIEIITNDPTTTLEECETSMEAHMDKLIDKAEKILSDIEGWMYYEFGRTLEKLISFLNDIVYTCDLGPQQLTNKKKRLREILRTLETYRKDNDTLMKVVIICAYVAHMTT